ncbi:MAG: hypothetical protein SFX74_12740 [Fimbriimonadaceae bacterium]|nr:hypothetical protein [Fimbriimonadaceae bacterium]
MSNQIFVRFVPIGNTASVPGEIRAEGYKDFHEFFSSDVGFERSSTTGVPFFNRLVMSRNYAFSSGGLVRNTLAQGQFAIEVHVVQLFGTRFRTIALTELRGARLLKYRTTAVAGESVPREEYEFDFAQLLWTYYILRTDGTVNGLTRTGWNLVTNQPISSLPPI